jgi:histidinol-phosphate aminotransferase
MDAGRGRGLVRGVVERLPPYRGLTSARPAVRLDGNENPLGPSPRGLAALASLEGEVLSRYPGPDRLWRRWARTLGVPPSALLLTSGSGPALALAAELTLDAGDACLLLAPSFELYGWAARRRDARVVSVPCAAGRPFPRRAFAAALGRERPRLVLLGFPDNPTGVAPPARWLAALTRQWPETLFVIDEAYHEYFGESMLREARRRPNVLVTRTLSKAYGLAGARVGAVVGPRRLIARLHRLNVPYPVTGPAVAIALAALADDAHVRRTVWTARRTSARLARELRALDLSVVRPRANFVLIRLASAAVAARLVMRLAERGVAVRDRSHLAGMAGVVRVTCGSAADTDRFLEVMRALSPNGRRSRGRRSP